MATRKKSGFSLEKLVLFVFIGGLIGFFIGRATAPKSEVIEGDKNAPVAVADVGQVPGDTGKKLDAIGSRSQ